MIIKRNCTLSEPGHETLVASEGTKVKVEGLVTVSNPAANGARVIARAVGRWTVSILAKDRVVKVVDAGKSVGGGTVV